MNAKTEMRATGTLAVWTFIWATTLAAARFGPDLIWHGNAIAGWTAVVINVAAGIGWIVAFTRYLRSLDDLQRKIMQDALAIAFGVGWVVAFAYIVALYADLIPEVDVAALPVLMSVVFLTAFVAGRVRYR